MNLSVLKKTRRFPERGDIFAMLPPDNLFLFGRVIATDAVIGPMQKCILIYIYSCRSVLKKDIPSLSRDLLLVPPIMTNVLPWKRGYFEAIESCPLDSDDVSHRHCFLDSHGRYFDEYSNRLSKPGEPIGQWGLHSFQTIDDAISKALGIPLSKTEISTNEK